MEPQYYEEGRRRRQLFGAVLHYWMECDNDCVSVMVIAS